MKNTQILLILAAVFITSTTYADTLRLLDNSLLTGKIINRQGEHFLFANSKGSFKVKAKFIKKIYRTSSAQEDINIHLKYGDNRDPAVVRENYRQGVKKKNRFIRLFGEDYGSDINPKKKKEKIRRGKRDKMGYHGNWTYGRLAFSMTYFTTLLSELSVTRNSNEVLPSGIAASMSYDQGLEFKKRSMSYPGLRLTHSYFYFTKSLFKNDIKKIQGHEVNLGLVWALPGLNSTRGYFTIFFLPGASMVFINNNVSHKYVETATFSLKTGIGYEIRYKKAFFQFNFNYNFLVDTRVSFNIIGGSFGVGFKLW